MAQSAGTRRLTGGKPNAEALYAPVGTAGTAGLPRCPGPGARVHMIGVGGCGMRGAAAVLLRRGVRVSGSDLSDSAELAGLRAAGGEIRLGQAAENVPADCDLVVCSAAVKATNPEVLAAVGQGCRVVKYSQLLGLLMADRLGIGVAGTHGKSTTTAMTAFVLRQACMDPCFVIGAQVEQLGGGSGVGDGPHFVVEACEYDRSFLNLHPRYAAILNVEEDHLDYYKDLDDIIEAFQAFTRLVPADGVVVVNGDDVHALRAAEGSVARVETFGLTGNPTWRADLRDADRGCWRFTVRREGRPLTDVQLAIPGRHHVGNALAAMALCLHGGVEPETIAKALGDFKGAYRRMTWRGCVHGVNVVDDYAHHPTELQVTIRAAREYYNPRKLFVVFQPHQHSRTRFLLDDFAHSFQDADVVLVPDIYFVRDSQAEREMVEARDLVRRIKENGRDARYASSFPGIVSQLCGEVEPGDLVVTMGAGDVWHVADDLLACLSRRYGG